MRWLFIALPLCLALAFAGLRFGILAEYDRRSNGVVDARPPTVSAEVRALHSDAFVADLHADSLLWRRDLGRRQQRGHVDLPRLQQGGVDLQVFSSVTRVPRGHNYLVTDDGPDLLPALFVASWRPPATWFSPRARALAQARELEQFSARLPLSLVLSRADLQLPGTKALLALEGMHALEGQPEALVELYDAGYRMMGLVHFFDNAVAGSAHGLQKGGLTSLGASLISKMESLGITVDLAHASSATIEEVLALAEKPVVVSHTGVTGTCPGPRNLSDDQLRALGANGAVIGIGFWRAALCDLSVQGIVAAIVHVIAVAGVDHVGLGSDFDGHVTTVLDVAQLPRITEALLSAGLTEDAVAKVLGGNVRRVLWANLPR